MFPVKILVVVYGVVCGSGVNADILYKSPVQLFTSELNQVVMDKTLTPSPWTTPGCPVPSFSYFFLFFEYIPIFSYLLNEISYFFYFLAGEANLC